MKALSDELRELAEEVETFPATGMIEVTRANNLLGRLVKVVTAAGNDSSHHIDIAHRMITSCKRLRSENETLRRYNKMLSLVAAVAVMVAAEACYKIFIK